MALSCPLAIALVRPARPGIATRRCGALAALSKTGPRLASETTQPAETDRSPASGPISASSGALGMAGMNAQTSGGWRCLVPAPVSPRPPSRRAWNGRGRAPIPARARWARAASFCLRPPSRCRCPPETSHRRAFKARDLCPKWPAALVRRTWPRPAAIGRGLQRRRSGPVRWWPFCGASPPAWWASRLRPASTVLSSVVHPSPRPVLPNPVFSTVRAPAPTGELPQPRCLELAQSRPWRWGEVYRGGLASAAPPYHRRPNAVRDGLVPHQARSRALRPRC